MTHRPHTQASHFWYWFCQSTAWAVLFLLNFSLTRQSPNAGSATLIFIWCLSSLSGLALTHGWRHILQQRLHLNARNNLPWLSLLGGVLLISCLQVILVFAAFLILNPPGTNRDWRALPMYLPVWLTVFALWTMLYIVVQSGRRARRLELEKLQLQVSAKDAELRALRAQINPHFFFNSLNSLRGLIFEDQQAAANMIDKLASMMRLSLLAHPLHTVPLTQELSAVRAYIGIEKIRFEERLLFSEDIEPGLDTCLIPTMLLQTLVENAVKYGVEPSSTPCQISLCARRNNALDANSVVISIANHGQLQSGSTSTQLGLKNTSERLRLLFGERAQFSLQEKIIDQKNWVVASLSLPCPSNGSPP